jgi:hypothetical protein
MHLSRPRRFTMCQRHEAAPAGHYIIWCHTKSDYVMMQEGEMPVAFVARDRGRRASRFYGVDQSIPLRRAM